LPSFCNKPAVSAFAVCSGLPASPGAFPIPSSTQLFLPTQKYEAGSLFAVLSCHHEYINEDREKEIAKMKKKEQDERKNEITRVKVLKEVVVLRVPRVVHVYKVPCFFIAC